MMTIIFSALILGLAGSLHCIGMCGPLVMAMPFKGENPQGVWFTSIMYHVGKTLTYGWLGLLVGTVGSGFTYFKWQQNLSIIAGLVLLGFTVIPILKKKFNLGLPLNKAFSTLYAASSGIPKPLFLFLLGMLNGLLPCGLVYAALAGAAVSASAWNGFVFMTFFGLGTIPSLTSVIVFQQKVSPSLRKIFSRSSFYISLLMAIFLLLRGMNLGIPYVSPKIVEKGVSCCSKP